MPSKHVEQAVTVPVTEYVLPVQATGVDAGSAHSYPPGQAKHCVLAAFEYVPDAHSEQEAAAAVEIEPAAQGEQVEGFAPAAAYLPAVQATGAMAGFEHCEPAGHCAQDTAPAVDAYVPTVQLIHVWMPVAPVEELAVPTEQGVVALQ